VTAVDVISEPGALEGAAASDGLDYCFVTAGEEHCRYNG
jgi:hypothetical protein